MTTTPSPACIAASPFASAPQQLLPAIPYLVGYRPSGSLVAVFLTADSTIALTARLDWDICRTDPGGAAAAICEQAARSHPSRVLLVAVDPGRQDDDALACAARTCEQHGLVVLWAGHQQGETWRGPDCDLSGCGPHRLDPEAPPATVTSLITQGRAVLDDRDAIAAEVAADGASPRPRARRRPRNVDLETWREELLGVTADVLADPAPVTDGDVAVIAAACRDVRVRDVLLWRLTVGPEHLLIGWPRAWDVVSEVLRRCARQDVAAVAAVGAVVAWQLGDGIRANACLDRAEAADPRHSLARLVRRSLAAGCPPSVWCDVMSGLTEEQCRYGGRRR